jgi:hypothetical protein
MAWDTDDLETLRDIRAQLAIIADVLTKTTSHSGDEIKMLAEKIFIQNISNIPYSPHVTKMMAEESIKKAYLFYETFDEQKSDIIREVEEESNPQ